MSKTVTYKTNIKCNGCIATVTPFLNKSQNISNWSVDLDSPDRLMTVEFGEEKEGEVENLLAEAGYEASKVS